MALLGYLLGIAASSLFIEWGWGSGYGLLGEIVFMCSVLFEVAFIFALVRFSFRGLRWAGRFLAGRWRVTAAQTPPASPSH